MPEGALLRSPGSHVQYGNTPAAGETPRADAESRRAWRRAYVRRIAVGDVLSAAVAGVAGYLVRFGADPAVAWLPLWSVVLFPAAWLVVMHAARSHEQRFLWAGPEEFRRVLLAAVVLLAGVGTVSWALKLEVARGLVILALPLAAGLTLLQRYAQRRLLHRARGRGRHLQRVVLAGHRAAVAALHEQMARDAHHGYQVIGCCLPTGTPGTGEAIFDGLPVLGSLDQVAGVAACQRVDTVAVLPCPELDGAALRRLGWELESTTAELLLAPALTEIAGPRVCIRPVSGLPLLHLERPELGGARRLTKEAFDRSAAVLGLLSLLPVFLTLAVAVKASSRGPIFFRQERVGRDGRTFPMLKFRSMVVDADRMVDALVADSDGNGVLFKKKNDPRVTPVGRVIRRYSLDELPQLINVLRGEMSLVGPRPPLQSEVERYGLDMHRRFLVKPGLTGLWQVSGRSDLSWDDSVRIDVRYVENWSLAFDFMILWKTVGAVLRGSGAY
ncbi:sugar transferase [Geodermatophilus sp. SYSU D01186]